MHSQWCLIAPLILVKLMQKHFHHVINQILCMHLLCTILNQLSHLGVNLKLCFLQYHIFIQELYQRFILKAWIIYWLWVWQNIFAFLYSTTATVLGHNRVTNWSSPKSMVTKQILVGFKVLVFHRIKVTTHTLHIARIMCQTLHSTKVMAQTIAEFCSPRQRTFLMLLNCCFNRYIDLLEYYHLCITL